MRLAVRSVVGCAAWVTSIACDGRRPQPGHESEVNPPLAGQTVRSRAPAAPASQGRGGVIEAWRVNADRPGLRVNVRWALSGDRRAMLVVHDPVSVEADPIPDGFLFADEASGTVVQVDGVWDVSPSPNWTRLAFGRAYVLNARERDRMPEEEWRRLEAQLPEDVAGRHRGRLRRELETHAFSASGMTLMLGLGVTQVLFLNRLGPGRIATPTGATHGLYGWRVRWTASGDTLGVGTAPRRGSDDDPPARWVVVPVGSWASYRDSVGGTTDSNRFAAVPWVEGPMMEYAGPIHLGGTRQDLPTESGMIHSRDGSIWIASRRGDEARPARLVGPGLPLVATAGGRFVAALVPRTEAKDGGQGMPADLVVYHIPPR